MCWLNMQPSADVWFRHYLRPGTATDLPICDRFKSMAEKLLEEHAITTWSTLRRRPWCFHEEKNFGNHKMCVIAMGFR